MTMRTFWLIAALCLLTLAMSACASSRETAPPPELDAPDQGHPAPPTDDEPAAPTPSAAKQFIADVVSDTVSLSIRDVRRRLGPPVRTTAEPIVNRHDTTQTDTLRTLAYDSLEVQFYDVTRSGKQLPTYLAFWGERYEGPQGLSAGLSHDSVRGVLGEPARRENGDLVFQVGSEPTPTALTVTFEDDAATRFQWSFYVD
jgi:hypothetical protein